MENLINIEKVFKKKKDHLHVPFQYIPDCKNFHPEKEMLRSRLKNKSIYHSARFLFAKNDEKIVSSPKIQSKIIPFDIINKKKAKEMVATYSLNEKLKIQRNLKNNQKEWIKKQHIKNSISLGAPIEILSEFELKSPNQRNILTENPIYNYNSNKNTSNNNIKQLNNHGYNIISPTEKKCLTENQVYQNNKMLTYKKNLSNFETNEDELIKINAVEKEKIIERTGLKIYGQDKYNQGKLLQMFQMSKEKISKESQQKKKSRKKKQKANSYKLQEVDVFPKYQPMLEENPEEHIKSHAINFWRYNSLTDDFEFNEDNEQGEINDVFSKENLHNYYQIKKKGTYDLAKQRLNSYKKSYEENEKEIHRNKNFLNSLSSKQIITPIIPSKNAENEDLDKDKFEYPENKEEDNEISEFDNNNKRNSLPLIIKKREFSPNNQILKSVHETLSALKETHQNHYYEKPDKHFFVKLAENIEGVCKKEHINHKKFLKNLKSEKQEVQTNIKNIKKYFQNLN